MLERIQNILKESAASAWEVQETLEEGWEFYFIRHNLDQNRTRNILSYDVQVYVTSEDRKTMGSAASEISPSASDEEIRSIIDGLCKNARFVSNPVYSLREKKDTEEFVREDFSVRDIAKDFIDTMNDLPETASENVNSYEIFVSKIQTHFINSNGVDITDVYPKSMIEVVTNARNEKHEIELYRLYHSGSCDKDALKASISKVLQYGADRLRTIPTPNLEKCDVLFSTEDSKSIYSYFMTHLSTQAVYNQLSDWKLNECIDEDVEGDSVTLTARRNLNNSSRNFAYDEEGAPIVDTLLLENNVPKAYWGDAMSSAYLNMNNTFRVSNYEVSGGSRSEADIRTGKYLEVVEFSDFQVSGLTGDVFGEIRLAYLHDGEQVTPVTGGSVSGNMKNYLKHMYMSKESVQYNNAVVPSVTKILGMTITGAN